MEIEEENTVYICCVRKAGQWGRLDRKCVCVCVRCVSHSHCMKSG